MQTSVRLLDHQQCLVGFEFAPKNIVRGGTAGLTLAARLTEDPDSTVGVFEVGYVYLKNDHSFLVLRLSRKTCFGNQSRCQLSRPVLQLNYLP